MKISNLISVAIISSMTFAPYAYAEYSTMATTPTAGETTTTTTTTSTNGVVASSADALITAKIKGLFVREELFGKKDSSAMGISVETKDGVVSLTGTAKDAKQLAQAVTLAKSVDGVKDVKSTVVVHDGSTTLTTNGSATGTTTTTTGTSY